MDIVEKLCAGKIKLHEIEKELSKELEWKEANKRAAEIRLSLLEKELGLELKEIRRAYVDLSKKGTTGIEQQIGGAITPLGIAGPLKINGEYAKGSFWLPLATNEAALVAGINRGCKAINKSGGVKVRVTRDFMARAPVLRAKDIGRASDVCKKIKEIFPELKAAAEKESRVSKLLDIEPYQLGRLIFLRFRFSTGDSMGMNSATKYSASAVRRLLELVPDLELISLTSNLCTDKKASHINVLLGRGKSVETEVFIPKDVLQEIWSTTPEKMHELNVAKNYQGSALSGTISGFNANVANTLAAMFIATGQDCAQLVESSSAFAWSEICDNGLRFGISMPCLEVATVGGGTEFGTALECLKMLGCAGPGKSPGENAKKLAEIMASAATAQELNLIGTLTNDFELAESHIRLARGL